MSYEPKKVVSQNRTLYDLLTKKGELVKEGRKYSQEVETLQANLNRTGLQIDKVKSKIFPLGEKEVIKLGVELGEFEEIGGYDVTGDGQIEITIVNVIEERNKIFAQQTEEYKKQFIESKKKK